MLLGAQTSSETSVDTVQLFFFIQAKVFLNLVNFPVQKPFYGSGCPHVFEQVMGHKFIYKGQVLQFERLKPTSFFLMGSSFFMDRGGSGPHLFFSGQKHLQFKGITQAHISHSQGLGPS